ncbi:MAG: DUF1800 family protein [Vicinamibacterales bacterium]|nr:DUF1800 family protein [Vicinamibacterales bacterium]
MNRLKCVGRFVAQTTLLLTLALGAPMGAATRPVSPPPPPPAEAPSSLRATAANARVRLTWSPVAGAKGYRVFRTANGQFDESPIASVGGVTFFDTNLINGTTYSYKVAAYTRGGNGPSSGVASAIPLAPPANLTATRGDRQVALNWEPSAGATRYTVYRRVSGQRQLTELASGVAAPAFTDTGLSNGTSYHYRVRATAEGSSSGLSNAAWAKPQPPPPAAGPASLTATAGNARVQLSWTPVTGATRYRIFRATTGTFAGPPIASVTGITFKNAGLTNGTTYYYRVTGWNPGGDSPPSDVAVATPMAPPAAPTGLTARAGDRKVTLSWAGVAGANGYNVYRGTTSTRQGQTPVATGLTEPAYADGSVENGQTYYFKVTAFNAGGESARSAEASASPEGPPPDADAGTLAAFRLLRQATWGPRPDDIDRVKTIGADAFLSEQFNAQMSVYPNALYSEPVEATQEHFMRLALTGPDQLRQRVAWALHKIWVVSAVAVDNASAMVTYQRVLMDGAFGNYRGFMRAMTLNPAMGRYLNMLNNRSQQVTGTPANENYARELLQLLTTGIPRLNPDGTPMLDPALQEMPVYSETDVKELARVFTGWTFGDGNPATVPTRLSPENYKVPMEVVERYHDSGEKTILGTTFPAGQSALEDLDQALDLLFAHANVGPFIGRQLIQQLVTSNPSPDYVASVASVFADNGGGVRGDLSAVVRAILAHPDASLSMPASGKLAEPALFIVSQLRALDATVTDHPFMSDKAEEMGQKVLYPPSVFSYYSPGFRVRGTAGANGLPLVGPEFQILTSVTALVRANFVGALLGSYFGSDVAIDYSPFTSRANDPAALVDYCVRLFMGSRVSTEQRAEMIAAVRVTPSTNALERARTALYLTMVAAQSQVDR